MRKPKFSSNPGDWFDYLDHVEKVRDQYRDALDEILDLNDFIRCKHCRDAELVKALDIADTALERSFREQNGSENVVSSEVEEE